MTSRIVDWNNLDYNRREGFLLANNSYLIIAKNYKDEDI